MTLKEFWDYPEKVVIHCKSKEQAIKLLDAFDKLGKKWWCGHSYKEKSNYIKDVCYTNKGTYCDYDYFQEDDKGVLILEFEEIEL